MNIFKEIGDHFEAATLTQRRQWASRYPNDLIPAWCSECEDTTDHKREVDGPGDTVTMTILICEECNAVREE